MKRMRKLFFVPVSLIAFLLMILLLAGARPVLRHVKELVARAAGNGLSAPLSIGRLSGNLFYSLRAEDVESPGLGRIEEMRISYNPLGLLRRKVEIRCVEIRGINLDIDRLIEVLSRQPAKTEHERTESPGFQITIHDLSITDGRLRKQVGRTEITARVHARGRLAGETLTIDTLRLAAEGSVASARGILPLNARGNLDITYDIRLALSLMELDGVEGDIQVQGTVSGPYSSIRVTANTVVDGRFHDHELAGWANAEWHVPDFGRLEISAGMRVVTALRVKGSAALESWDVELDLQQSRLSARITSGYGAARLSGILKGSIDRPYLDGSVRGRLAYAGFDPSFEGLIGFHDGIIWLRRFKITSTDLVADLSARLNTRSNEILSGRVSISCTDLSVAKCFSQRLEDISGQLRFDMDIRGALQAPSAKAGLILSGVTFYGEEIDSIILAMSADRGRFALEQGWIESARGRVNLSGRYDPGTGEFSAALAAPRLVFRSPEVFGADTVAAGAVLSMDLLFSGDVRNPGGVGTIAIESLVYDTFALGNYHLKFSLADTTLAVSLANGRQSILTDAEMYLRGDMPFTATLKAGHFALEDHLTIARGHITADLAVQGDLVQPDNLTALLRIDTARITVEERLLENIGPVKARLEQGVVTIETCELAIAGQSLRLEGRIPLDHQHGAIDLYAATPSIELSDVASFLPTHPALSGTMQLELRAHGMAGAPDIDGRLKLIDGRYEDAHVLVDSVTCRLGMSNNVIRIDELAGRINRGRFRVRGSAGLAPGRLDTMFLDISVNRARYENKDFGRVVLSTLVQVSGRRDSLQVVGEIVIDDGVYDVPVRLQSIIGLLTAVNRPEPQQPEIMRRIYCDIGISVPDRFRIANNVADLAARADLQVRGYLARLNVYGTVMAVGPGTVQYLGRKFQIVSGVIAFDDPYRIDPVIELAAVTSVATAEGSIDIYLFLTGKAADYQLELSSNPPLPEQDIVSLLLIGRRRPGEVGSVTGDIDLKGKARDFAFDAIRQGLEKSTQDILGLDKFTLTGDLGEPMTMRIGVEKRIVKGFTLLYNTGVESWELYQIGASYDLTDHISIFTLHDQENLNTSIDLNFRFKLR